ncbi:MAG TPA: germination protein YpeB [Thermoanaerobacterales bacterium]|nr:germination protein YpeB [Thermoanaerobacterales bacterium]
MKRTYLWLIGLLIIGGITFGFWSVSNRAYSAENALEASYQKGFFDLIEQVNNLDILISKSLVTSSDAQRIMTFTTIWHQAEGARTSLSQLPLGQRDMTNSQKFFAQLGDFSYSLAKKIVNGEKVTADEWKKIENFKKYSQALNKKLRELQGDVAAGRIKWENRAFAAGRMKKLPQAMADKFSAIDQKLKDEAPTITYDGPFSDHVENIKPMGVTGASVTELQAKGIAADFVDNPGKVSYSTSVTGKAKGIIPAYNIEFSRKGGKAPEILIDVSEKGGHVIWYLNTRTIGERKIDLEKAVDRARAFLNSRGYTDMEPTGSLIQDNTVTITFVPKDGEVLLYPDFIKTEVALDDGQIVGFDGMGYYTFHRARKLPPVKLSKQDVIDRLNKNLKVDRIRLAIIPDPALKEKLCYEVDAKLKDERYFVYINAENGTEEQILKIVETDNGTMTM